MDAETDVPATEPGQVSFENFYLPFGGKLSGENRWVKLAAIILWESFESSYAAQFSGNRGAPAKPFRMALGALMIQERLGVSDDETVEQVRENSYLQYFLGLFEYSDRAPFDASMMTHFRQRLSLEPATTNSNSINRYRHEQSLFRHPKWIQCRYERGAKLWLAAKFFSFLVHV